MITFYKMHGAGNDFIVFDIRNQDVPLNPSFLQEICHRRFGIGADGVMTLGEAENADFTMQYFNSDGSPSTMCGNGGRCIVHLAHYLGIVTQKARFAFKNEIYEANITEKGIRLKMKDVHNIEQMDDAYVLDTGSPHLVKFVDNVHDLDVDKQGRVLRNSSRFKEEGINVNFCSFIDDYLYVRTYERGVEAETLACGTGVTASAIVHALLNGIKEDVIKVKTKGGILNVTLNYTDEYFQSVFLTGPAVIVAEGKLLL